jgi:WD40 repeat protein/predicted Ser/Thr protein kinase
MSGTSCPRCQSSLAEGTLEGQCPRCLAALAFGLTGATETPGDATLGGLGELGQAGEYILVRELGRGGMGVVYEARQPRLQRRVAVKMLLAGGWAEPAAKARFLTEASAAARLRHPGIVAVHEVGEWAGQPFIAMELVEGPSLADLARARSLAPRTAARYLRRVAEAITHAHSAGILHRDLKPANVLIDSRDEPRVTDFGLAKDLDSTRQLTRSGELMGSPNYLAPEQLAGVPAAPAGDIYAMGALLYQLVTARPPFVAPTVAATLELVRTAEPVAPRLLNPEVPRDLETICLKCLLKEPERRYASAAELAADLARFEAGEPILARPVPAVERVVLWCRRKPTLAAVSVALIVALILGIAGIVWQWRRAESSREEMRRNLYAADLAAASGAVRDGNLGQARRLLGRYRSQPGSQDLREFTWRMLSDRGDELTTLGTHPGVVTCVAISPDGQWAASGSQNPSSEPGSALRLWRLPGLAQGLGTEPQAASSGSRALPVTGTVWSVAFTPDSRTLVSAGTSGLRTWEVVPGGPTPRIPQREALEVTVAGTRLVASANHPFFENGSPQPLWWCDWTTGESGDLPLRGRHPSLSPDGRRLAYLDATHDVRVVEVADPRQVRTVSTNRLVFRLRFSPDGRYLAAAGQVTSARVWDLADWNAPGLAFEGEHNVWDAAFSADGTSLFTATSDQRIELWDMERRARTAWLEGHANEVWTVVATPDGRFLVSGSKDGTVRLWSAGPPSPRPSLLQERQGPPRFNTDGSRVLTQTRSNGVVMGRVWELSGPEPRRSSRARAVGSVGQAGAIPLGFAAEGGGDVVVLIKIQEAKLEFWRPDAAAPERSIALAGGSTAGVAPECFLSRDGRSLVVRSAQGGLGRWAVDDGRRLGTWSAESLAAQGSIMAQALQGRLRRWAVSRTGRWVALAPFGLEGACLVDLQADTAVLLRGHRDDVAALAFAPGEEELATGSIDGTIRLWSVPEGQLVGEIPGHLESVEALAYSVDGRTVASGTVGTELKFWHRLTRRELARFSHTEIARDLTFSPDGLRLWVNASEGRLDEEGDSDRVEIWDAPDVP